MRILAFLLVGAVSLTACGGSDGTGIPPLESRPAAYYSWMHPDVERAWGDGFLGQGARVTVVDNFITRDTRGNLGGGNICRTHGHCVEMTAGMIAPEAELARISWSNNAFPVDLPLSRRGALSVFNLSYGLIMPVSDLPGVNLGRLDRDLVDIAHQGTAVVVKSAGNGSGTAVDSIVSGSVDILNLELVTGRSHIFVGALAHNGSEENLASLASYSSIPGDNQTIQDRFLVVGVNERKMDGLPGTSFAAPIVSGYAAILGSKFEDVTPSQIASRLLDTAREDTIRGFDPALHGRGEASLSRALAPDEIH